MFFVTLPSWWTRHARSCAAELASPQLSWACLVPVCRDKDESIASEYAKGFIGHTYFSAAIQSVENI
jgi:hypothetical protein